MLRKLILWFQIYSLAIMMDNRYRLMNMVTDPVRLGGMQTTQDMCEGELWRLKNEYSKYL